MSETPHQAILKAARLGGTSAVLMLVSLTGFGCASGNARSAGPLTLACFPSRESTARVVVYGGLGNILPKYDATPALERFLYGPSDFGKTMLGNPQGMAVSAGRLLVCDQGQSNVIAIDLATGRSAPWVGRGHRLRCPVDVTVGENGCAYVADTVLGSVLAYDTNGRFIETLAPAGEPPPRFRPCSVLACGGILYVGNLAGCRVDRWSAADHRWLTPLIAPDEGPRLIAPTGLARTDGGVLLVADAVQGIVRRIAADGRWLGPIGRPGWDVGRFVRPKQIGCTASGLILVSDAGRQSVLVFEPDGRYLTEIRGRGDGWRGWTLPMGLAMVGTKDLPDLAARVEAASGQAPDEFVIVSDSLGDTPLTVLGIVHGQGKGLDVERTSFRCRVSPRTVDIRPEACRGGS